MREGWPFAIYAHARVLAILKANSIFNVLGETKCAARAHCHRREFLSRPCPTAQSQASRFLPFAVPGKGAWYLEGKAHPAGNQGEGDTLGLRIEDKATGRYFYFLAALREGDA